MNPVAEPIPQGDTSSSPLEEKFPIALPFGLTASSVKERSKEFRKRWKTWADKQATRIEVFHKMFMAEPTGPQRSKATTVLSICSGIIETLASRLDKGILGRDGIVDVMPLDPDVPKEVTKTVEDFINQEVIYRSRGTKKGKSLIKSALIDGVGVWRDKWVVKKERRSVPQYEAPAMGIEPIYVGEAVEEVTRSYWDWEEKDFLTVGFEPGTETSMADSPWSFISTHMSLGELKKWQEEGKITGVDEIATITPSGVSNAEDWETKRKSALGGYVNNFAYAHHREYKVDEWYGELVWEVEQEGEDEKGQKLPKKIMCGEYHWIIVEESVLILFEENPLTPVRKPVGSFPIIIDPRKVVGKSSLHDVAGIQQMINMFAGKQVDLVEIAANRPVYYDKRSGLSGRTAFQRTQGMVPVNDVNGIKEGTVDTSAIQATQSFISFLIEFARNLTAATEQAQGLEGAGTATEFAGLMQLVGTRFEDLADNIVQFLCVPLAQGCLDFYQQYGVDGDMVVRESSIDGNSKLVTRQMLAGRWQIIPRGTNAQANKESRIKGSIEVMKMLMELGNAAMANPALTEGQMPNLKEYFNQVVLTLMDQPQTQNFWTSPPPMGLPPMGAEGAMDVPGMTPPPAGGVSPEAMGMPRPA